MLLHCGTGEDSWESLGVQGDQKEINLEYSLEGLMLKLQYCGHLIARADSLEKTLLLLLLLSRFSHVRLCDTIDGSPPGSPVPGILQARTLGWVAISFSRMLGKIGGRKRRGRQRIRWLKGITDSMDMIWVSSRRWWKTGKTGVLQSMKSQRVGYDWKMITIYQ